jgi:hypothetical protein
MGLMNLTACLVLEAGLKGPIGLVSLTNTGTAVFAPETILRDWHHLATS